MRSCGRVRESVSENSCELTRVVYNHNNHIDRRVAPNSITTRDVDEDSETRRHGDGAHKRARAALLLLTRRHRRLRTPFGPFLLSKVQTPSLNAFRPSMRFATTATLLPRSRPTPSPELKGGRSSSLQKGAFFAGTTKIEAGFVLLVSPETRMAKSRLLYRPGMRSSKNHV